MHTHYPKEAFEKMADYLYKATDIEQGFVFGESRLGSYDFIHQTRELAAVQEFYEALPWKEKANILCDSVPNTSEEIAKFIDAPWVYIVEYLTTWADWRADATEITQQFLKDCAEGKRNDDNINSAMESDQ